MKIATMRKADKWVGIPVCFLLTLWRRMVAGGNGKATEMVRRIVFVKLAEQGTTVLAYSAIQRAVEMVGRENVFFLTFEHNRFILDAIDLIPGRNVVSIPARGVFSAFFGAVRAIYKMRKERIDAAIDFEFFSRSSAAMCYLSGASQRVGLHAFVGEAPYRGDLMTHRISYNPHLHISQTFETMVEALNVSTKSFPAFEMEPPAIEHDFVRFCPGADEIEDVKCILTEEMVCDGSGPLILFNPNCSDLLPLRQWPNDRYVELGGRLLEKYPEIHVVFTGSAAEKPFTEQLVRRVGSERCFCLAGKTNLRQLLVLYCLAEILVTNDSGPAQFATLTPIDVITLFGPETPTLFAARTPRNHVIWAGIVCSPCVSAYNNRKSGCRNNICMQRISPNQVFEQVCKVYDRRIKKH